MVEVFDNTKQYEAEMRALAILPDGCPAAWFRVHSTCEHPDSSYGIQVWVDDEGHCYGAILYPSAFYELRNVRELQG